MVLDEFLSEWHNDSDRLLVHTSGSTGKPKPLWVEKRRMEASARKTCRFLGLKPGDTALLCLPLDYIAGKMMVVRSLVGGLRLTCTEPSSHPLADVEGPFDLVAMVPMQVYHSLQVPAERRRLMQVRHLIIGGGPVDDGLAEILRAFPHAVWSTYGMTETLSHIALRRLSGGEASSWYTPFEGVDIGLSPEGTLVIEAPDVCGQRLVTNDIAQLEPAEQPDGRPRFRIVGRRDNVICSGGLKIQAEEVERLLRPWLRGPFLVSRRTDGRLGEAVVLLTEETDVEAVERVCRRVLPRHWAPRHYVRVDALPLTGNGKPDRCAARRLAQGPPEGKED